MKTILEQTGWRRGHPLQVCMEITALEKVSEFSYDVRNESFRQYFTDRTGYTFKCDCGLEEVLSKWANPDFQITDKPWMITRAKLQDCWEVFTSIKS